MDSEEFDQRQLPPMIVELAREVLFLYSDNEKLRDDNAYLKTQLQFAREELNKHHESAKEDIATIFKSLIGSLNDSLPKPDKEQQCTKS